MKLGPDVTAVIIGGAGGIGRGTALGLAAKGVRCVIADIEADNAETVAAELRGGGTEAVAMFVDATDRDSLAALADRVEAEVGSIRLLSNNVGIMVDAALVESTDQEWGWAVEFILMSIVRANAVIVPRMLAHGDPGHVVNTASMAGLLVPRPEDIGGVRLGIYNTTKHAVVGYSATLRDELADDGIGVSCACPGTVDSNLTATSLRNRPERFGGPQHVGDTAGNIPWAMKQEEVGKFVVAAVEGNRAHVLTHPRARGGVERAHAALLDDFDYFSEIAKG